MRQPAHRQSAMRNPLNHILGTESGVRILRVLSQTRQPLSAADLARMTTLNPTGVRNSIEELIGTGILSPVGGGSRWLVRLRPDHPLTPALRRLFAAEAARAEILRKAIGKAAQELIPPPRSVWMQGPVADGTDKPGVPLTVGVLASGGDLESTLEALREKIAEMEKQQDVTVEVRGFSKADLSTVSVQERSEIMRAIPLWGPPPTAFIEESPSETPRSRKRTHGSLDARSLALATKIAQKLREDPSLIERARQRVAARMRTASPGERKELKEWDRVLRSASPRRLQALLTDPGPRATRLRQTLPFLDALTRDERDYLLKMSRKS